MGSCFSGDSVVLCLSEEIDDKALNTLMKLGLRDRFQGEFAKWERRREEIKQRFQAICTGRQNEMHTNLERDLEDIKVRLREAVIIEVLKAYPWVLSAQATCQVNSSQSSVAIAIDNRFVPREAILPKSSFLESARFKVEPNDATRKTYCIYFPRISVLTLRLDPLHDLFRILPESEQTFRDYIRSANFEKGFGGISFQTKKKRILILYHLLKDLSGLDRDQIRILADAVLNQRDTHTIIVLGLLKVSRKEDKGIIGYINTKISANQTASALKNNLRLPGKGSYPTKEEALWRDANDSASSVSDSRFFSLLSTASVDECLHEPITVAKEAAYHFLLGLINSLVDRIGQQVFTIQKEKYDKRIRRQVTSEEDKELVTLRSEFVYQVQDLSREHSQSYVHYSLGLWAIL
jgi:hypothetical protein